MTYFLHFMETQFKLGEYISRDGRTFVIDAIREGAAFPLRGYLKKNIDCGVMWKSNGWIGGVASTSDLVEPVSEMVSEMVKVPLGPDDVPPNSIFRCAPPGNSAYYALFYTLKGLFSEAVIFGEALYCDWETLQAGWEISRDNGRTWEPCEKLVPA